MKQKIHPEYKEVAVTCSCGNTFVTRSTVNKKEITIEICSMCHPFYTGTQKLMDTGGRVDRFRQKYGKKEKTAEKAVEKTEEPQKKTVETKKKEKPEIEPKKKKTETKKKTTAKKKESGDKEK